MLELKATDAFLQWLARLRDVRGKAAIAARLDRLRLGALGDARYIDGGVSELRIHCGPGYRVYFTRRGDCLMVLLCAGDKGSQVRDIARARLMVGNLGDIK